MKKKTEGLGAQKIRAGNRIYWARKRAEKADALRARNAYRAAIGLPPIPATS